MRIVICGSFFLREKMIENKKALIELGHEAVVHPDYESFVRGKKKELLERVQTEHAVVKKENNYIKWYYDAIVNSDAVLVLNYDKKGIKNYVGGNTLMEIAFAHINNKKIFLMNPVPQDVSYTDEIEAMYDEVLDGDLSKIGLGEINLSLREIADDANKIEDELGLTFDDVLHKFTQECGEFNDAVQKFRGRYCRESGFLKDIKSEVGDLLFNLSSVCNRLGIDSNEFNKFARETLKEFEGRKGDYRK